MRGAALPNVNPERKNRPAIFRSRAAATNGTSGGRFGTGMAAIGLIPGLLLVVWMISPGPAAAAPGRDSPQAFPAGQTAAQWAEDLDFLGRELPARHKNLFHRLPESDFRSRLEALKAALPDLHPDEILAGVLRLVAAVGDSHTTVGYRPRAGLPLMLYWFADGLYVLNTTPDYRDILFGRIVAVNGKPWAEAAAVLAEAIPHENEAQVRNQAPNLLADTALLHGLGLLPAPDAAAITVVTESGDTKAVTMTPVPFTSQPAWIADTGPPADAPLALRNPRVFYWFEVLPESGTLYFKYNSCQEMPGRPFADFVKDLLSAADDGSIERLVIDLRHNGGGNSGMFRPFLDGLAARPRFARPGSVCAIVGRRTFSSAVLNALELRQEAGAVLAGEPSGGKPNHYGEVRFFQLPQSKLAVTYSTKHFQRVDGDPASIVPELAVEQTFDDYRRKVDPVLELILGHGAEPDLPVRTGTGPPAGTSGRRRCS